MASGTELFDLQHTSPPILLVNRTATVQLGVVNTIRYPGDLFERRQDVWFQSGVELGSPADPRGLNQAHPVRNDNHVRFLIDGQNAMSAMGAAMEQTGDPGDFIYMLNWWADPSLMISTVGKRLGDILADASDRGVQVRGMFWHMGVEKIINEAVSVIESVYTPWIPADRRGVDEQNEQMVKLLNTGLGQVNEKLYDPSGELVTVPTNPNRRGKRVGAAIHDSRLNAITVTFKVAGIQAQTVTTTVGSHHQKILCVKARGQLVAFCGGIDFNRDRVELERMTFHGAPLHDVHLEVRGPAAGDLVSTFVARWTDHPDSAALDQAAGALVVTASDLKPPPSPSSGRHIVQMGRTFGGKPLLKKNKSDPTFYRFAPQGEQTARDLIRRAILSARKFIYLEDQYLVSAEASDLLKQVLEEKKLAHITIVLPHHEICDLPISVRHRRAVIKNLKEQHPDRVRVFYKTLLSGAKGEFHSYVHSKITVIDDEFAVVGTVNYGRRSWSHDSEVNVGIYDPSSESVLTSRFAHWFRMRVWAEHLFGTVVPPTPPGQVPQGFDKEYAELFDGVAAGALWLRLIELKEKFLRDNPNQRPKPGGPHPRDSGFDQASVTTEPLARTAVVRPYDEDDDPDEIKPFPLKAAQIALSLSDEQIYDTFCDPA
jgi:phosphatidylserine/phosphatidylglycerophosphate/cardiolipin synthase-like enzyme